jgi:signal transduction histidine kinase
MLHEFLLRERDPILALCKAKLKEVSDDKDSSNEMDVGLPIFYDELIEVLCSDEEESTETEVPLSGTIHNISARRRGKESFRLGYTVSQVVRGYGALCQAVTEYAAQHNEAIGSREFNRLNFCLDVAVAEAVTEFNKGAREVASQDEVQRLGFLAHEMRNALSNVAMSYQMIKKGIVGVGGSTNMVLEASIRRMKDIIDRSLAEVRLRGEPMVDSQRCRLVDLVGEVETTASFEANDKSIQLHVQVSADLVVFVDRHLMVAAIANLVQNAIKFTPSNGNVWIRASAQGEQVLVEVEDQCGGLPPGKIEELFQPFTQKGSDRTGLGLGLSISTSAIHLCNGQVSARDLPGHGCVFTIELPRMPTLPGESEGRPIPVH